MTWNSTLSPGGRLRRQSKRTKAKARDRKRCVEAVRARSGGICEYPGCREPATEVHEILPRSAGGSITDEENCRDSCSRHHRHVHENPAHGRAIGWIRTRSVEEHAAATGRATL